MSATVTLVTTRAQAEDAMMRAMSLDTLLAFDTETTGLQVRSGNQDIGRTIQFSWRPWDEAWVFEMTEEWKPYIDTILNAATELVGHNVRFDAHIMKTFGVPIYGVWAPDKIHDTSWLAALNDERDRTALKSLAARYLKDDAASEQAKLKRLMKKHDWTWATVPVNYLVEYGGLDAVYTGQLFDLFMPRISHCIDAYGREQRLSAVLFKMERVGLNVDQVLLQQIIDEEREAVASAKKAVLDLVPGINPNAAHQVKQALRERGHDLENTEAATLKAIDDDLARAILLYRTHAKTLGTYAEPWFKFVSPEGRIHTSFKQLGAMTGRFSTDQPSLQNVSKSDKGAGGKLRHVFVAAPGHSILVADWNQMELRMYAHFAKDESMRAAFLSGDDIYQQVSDVLKVPRAIGKMIMLSSIYGAGPKTLKTQCIAMAYKYDMPELVPELFTYDWKELHEKFHGVYKIKDLARLTELAARRRGMYGDPYIITLGGRRQRPKRIKLPAVNGYSQTIYVYKDLGNSLVQGSSSDLMKKALIDVDQLGYGHMLRLTVHDEMVLEVPDEQLEEVAAVVRRVMTHNEFIPPLTAEVSWAERYGEAK